MLSIVIFITGCGGVADSVQDMYPLEDVMYGDEGSTSKVYRAQNQTVQQVAGVIAEKNPPRETSTEDPERMFLVYQNELIQVMNDPKNSEDTLVEVSQKEFVRRHYNNSFLETYLMFRVVDSLFGGIGRRDRGGYGGYVERSGRYSSETPGGSIRYGSRGAKGPRGGGPGSGK